MGADEPDTGVDGSTEDAGAGGGEAACAGRVKPPESRMASATTRKRDVCLITTSPIDPVRPDTEH